MVIGRRERLFAVRALPRPRIRPPTLLTRHGRPSADRVTDHTEPLNNLARQLPRVRALPRTQAVTVVGSRAKPEDAALAVEFSAHLTALRKQDAAAVTITGTGPESVTVPGWRWVPHLLSVIESPGCGDRVVWELMPEAVFPAWLGSGGSTMEPEELRALLPSLLELRQHVRTGTLGETQSARELEALLRHRYLSTLFVLQHAGLVRRVLNETIGAA